MKLLSLGKREKELLHEGRVYVHIVLPVSHSSSEKNIDLTFCLGVERNGRQGGQAVNKYKVVRALRKNKAQVRGGKDEVVHGESAILRHHNEEKHL